mgnify:CR=1 FL=1
MKSLIKKFLDDLYEIDPTLKDQQATLVSLLEKLLAHDPATAPDPAFVVRLREELHAHAEASTPHSLSTFWQKFGYAFGGALTAAVIIPLAIIATNQNPVSPEAPLFSNSVKATGNNAFGSLKDISAANGNAAIPAPTAMRGQGGGGGGGIGLEMVRDTATSAVAPDSKMIAPWPMVQYQYVFSGSLKDLQSTVAVYKKTSTPLSLPLSAIADRINIGGLNFASFNGMNVDNLTFTQQTSYGYQMTVNLRDASVSIDANWEQWPQSKCQTDACYQAQRVKIGDIPADDVIIGVAKAFASQHGINLAEYGEPEVDNAWRTEYNRVTDTSIAYIPDMQRVIFPQLINGNPVYDQSGIKTRLSISVNVKQKKVMSVWGIMDRSYLKSDYAGVTDEAAIRKFVSSVDDYSIMGREENTKTPIAKVILGTPTLSYATYYRYTDNKNEELLVPSLIFPVDHVETDGTQPAFYRTQIVVPLAQDMLDEQSARPEVMPMMKGGVMMDSVGPSEPVNQ